MDLSQGPLIMGILNVTPDSFSDGGQHNRCVDAVNWARQMRDEGAQIIDVGGESTRPGFDENAVSLEEECQRVLPVVQALVQEGFVVSVDTSKPEVMTRVAQLGAHILNDVRGFTMPGALEAASQTNCGLVIMHRRPKGFEYDDLMADVTTFLAQQVKRLQALGVCDQRICLDPGFGFGKTVPQNYELIAQTPQLKAMGFAVMVALSRKSSIGQVTQVELPQNRVTGSVVAAILGAQLGADVLRVHDVRPTWEAVQVLKALRQAAH